MKKNGKLWVLGMLGLGAAAAGTALLYWKDPRRSSGQTFTLFHSLLIRKQDATARQLLADAVTLDGRTLSGDEFMRAYPLPRKASEIDSQPCPGAAGHWWIRMESRAYCFAPHGSAWRLHWVGDQPCGCR